MRRFLLLTLFVVALAGRLPAQSIGTVLFATVGGGLGAYDNNAFSNRLRSYTPINYVEIPLIYQTEEFSNGGATLNAGIGALIGGWLMVGASGERVMFPTVRSITGPGQPQDEYRLAGMGGGIDLGYALVNDDAVLLAPFAQIGYYGYSLEYTNHQNLPVPFFEGTATDPGSSTTFTGSAPRFALGLQLVRFLASGAATGSPGGLAFSARLSYGSMIDRPLWELDGVAETNGGHTPAFNSLELTIGIGGALGL